MAALAESTWIRDFTLAGLPMPVTLHLPELLSDEELIAFSRNNRPYRIERDDQGDLEIMSPLGFEGGQREIFVMVRLANWADECGGGVCVSSDTGFTLRTGGVRAPDASWTSNTSLEGFAGRELRGFVPVCPDFLIEVLSESDSRKKLEEKMQLWMRNDVRLAWMIDPFAATVTIYRPGQEPEQLIRPAWVEADTVVTGFRLETSRLWAK